MALIAGKTSLERRVTMRIELAGDLERLTKFIGDNTVIDKAEFEVDPITSAASLETIQSKHNMFYSQGFGTAGLVPESNATEMMLELPLKK